MQSMLQRYPELAGWVRDARAYIVKVAMDTEHHQVSVNDIFMGIVAGLLTAPPKIEGLRSGQAMSIVLNDSKIFQRTELQVPGVNPASKGRKVWIWLYMPEQHDAPSQVSRASVLSQDAHVI